MSSQVSTSTPQTAMSNIGTISLRLCGSLLAVAGIIKVAQTGAYGFALVLVVPWVVVAARTRPGPRAALTAVIIGTLELALAGSRFAAGGTIEWFDSLVMTTTFIVAPVTVALSGYLLLRPRQH